MYRAYKPYRPCMNDCDNNFCLQDDDKAKGGITLERYQELYAHFIGNPDETCNGCYLFGPLEVIE